MDRGQELRFHNPRVGGEIEQFNESRCLSAMGRKRTCRSRKDVTNQTYFITYVGDRRADASTTYVLPMMLVGFGG